MSVYVFPSRTEGLRRMKHLKSWLAASLLIVGGLIYSLCLSGLVTNSVSAANARRKDEKISGTLRSRNSSENVQVIIQLNSSPSGRLNALLQRNGVHVKDDFK